MFKLTIVLSCIAVITLTKVKAQDNISSGQRIYSKVSSNIPYKSKGKYTVFDAFYPAVTNDKYPTHIFIHGGGWIGGTKKLSRRSAVVFAELAKAGFVGISIDYRRSNCYKRMDGEARRYIRTCVIDCMDALRYLFSHANELKLDTDNMFIWGESAGGHLALLCATAPLTYFPGDNPEPAVKIKFKHVVAWFPSVDIVNYEQIAIDFNKKKRDISRRLGKTFQDDPVAYSVLSPLEHLTRNDPEISLYHGDVDKTLNIEHSIRLKEKAGKLGVPCELHIIKNADHCFISRNGKPIEPSLTDIYHSTARVFIKKVSSVEITK